MFDTSNDCKEFDEGIFNLRMFEPLNFEIYQRINMNFQETCNERWKDTWNIEHFKCFYSEFHVLENLDVMRM